MATTGTAGTGGPVPGSTVATAAGTAGNLGRMDVHHNNAHGGVAGAGVGGGATVLQHQLASLLDTAQRLLAESAGVSGYTQDYGKIAAAPQPAVYTLMAMQVCQRGFKDFAAAMAIKSAFNPCQKVNAYQTE